MRTRPPLLTVALIVALFSVPALLAACGDDDEDGGEKVATTSAPKQKGSAALSLTQVQNAKPIATSRQGISNAGGAGGPVYCSPSGDYCIGVRKLGRNVRLALATLAFRGSYRLCLSGPPGRACKTFPLRKQGRVYGSTINFTPPAPGRYSATWFYGGTRLGRALTFTA